LPANPEDCGPVESLPQPAAAAIIAIGARNFITGDLIRPPNSKGGEVIRFRGKNHASYAMQCFDWPSNDCPVAEELCKRARILSPRIAPVQLALTVRSLNKTYHAGPKSRSIAVPALRDVSLDADAGEIVGLVGRPGSGKS